MRSPRARDQRSRVRAEPPDAVHEQLDAVEAGGVSDGERVLAVVPIGPTRDVASVEIDERGRLRLRLGRLGRERGEEVGIDRLLTELAHEPPRRVGKAGRLSDRLEVPAGGLARSPRRSPARRSR